ncbi:Cohesin Subunit Sa-3 [Manis pentadactyla]|nr:Cohesin Subunit Sa-3 [Manis pentadactyla]
MDPKLLTMGRYSVYRYTSCFPDMQSIKYSSQEERYPKSGQAHSLLQYLCIQDGWLEHGQHKEQRVKCAGMLHYKVISPTTRCCDRDHTRDTAMRPQLFTWRGFHMEAEHTRGHISTGARNSNSSYAGMEKHTL